MHRRPPRPSKCQSLPVRPTITIVLTNPPACALVFLTRVVLAGSLPDRGATPFRRAIPSQEHSTMNRQIRSATSLGLCVLTLVSGCTPIQPFYFKEDGDLSHYMDVATEVEYPDVNAPVLDEVQAAQAPLTLANAQNFQMWDLSLEEATKITLQNSQVIKQLGGRINDLGQNISTTTPETLTTGAAQAVTTYDPALSESAYGGNTGSQFSGTGPEAALSEFDAQLDSSVIWQNNDRPQNFGLAIDPDFFNPLFRQDIARYTTGITKNAGNGSTFELRNNINYDQNNNGSRTQPSDWFVNLEAAFTQPLLQGAGTQYNRIAGPRSFQEATGGFSDQIDGVIIARLRTDITLTDFEVGVRNLMRDVETAYWELYFSYRDLEARKIGQASALESWRRVKAKERVGGEGGEANTEAQARSQYFLFRSQVETALTNLFRVENRLRYLMGLSVSDGRLIRPSDEPTTAQVHFDWATIQTEALARREELRRQRWTVKRRELELIAAKNQLLPRLDAIGRYRWLGAGDELLDSQRNGIPPFLADSTAFESLTGGDFQEWELGVQFAMQLGMRRGMTTVRHHQLLLARERAVLQDMELEVSHELGDAVRDVDLNFGVAQTNFNRRAAAEDEVEAVNAIYEVGRVTLDLLLDAQRRRAEAESAYYRSLVDYNRAVMLMHYRKGSLLEYNGVYLAEGPWPGKAYFDAMRRARRRDASLYMDYGFTRPSVISRGPYSQNAGTAKGGVYEGPVVGGPEGEKIELKQPQPLEAAPNQEAIPAPITEPLSVLPSQNSTVRYIEPIPVAAPMAASPPLSSGSDVASPSPANSTPLNPFPRDAASVTPHAATGLPAGQPIVNPFTSPTTISELPANETTPIVQPVAYEYQANYPATEAAANVASGTGGQR
jgi:outer membrane protein TolC